MDSNLLNFLEDLNSQAVKSGASAADSIVIDDTAKSLTVRLGKLEDSEYSRNKSFGLRVFVGNRHAIVSSSDFSKSSIDMLINQAISMAKVSPEDIHTKLAEKSELYNEDIDLELFDNSDLEINQMLEIAKEAEEAALKVKNVTNSEGSQVGISKSEVAIATTNGLLKSFKSSSFSTSCSVIASSEGGMETDYDYTAKRFFQDLDSAEKIGKSAGERAAQKLNPRKIQTTKVPVIFPKRFSHSLIVEFLGAINGANIAKKSSFLLNDMDKQIFSDKINIKDNPLIKRGLKSRSYDVEGLECRELNIVEKGILNTWLLDLRTASLLGLKSTASATRGIVSNPVPTNSNLYVENGDISLDEMIKNMGKGLIVTSLFGGGVNLLTGNYSQGASGLWVENGEICYPVSEITVASNLRDMYSTIIPANDLEMKYSVNSPSLLVENMTVAGS